MSRTARTFPTTPLRGGAARSFGAQFPEGPPGSWIRFCGGGSTLVEAQRLGLQHSGSDMNPVPVLISSNPHRGATGGFGGQPLHSGVASGCMLAGRAGGLRSEVRGPDGRHQVDGLIRDVMYYGDRCGIRRGTASRCTSKPGWKRSSRQGLGPDRAVPEPGLWSHTMLASRHGGYREERANWPGSSRGRRSDVNLQVVTGCDTVRRRPTPKSARRCSQCVGCHPLGHRDLNAQVGKAGAWPAYDSRCDIERLQARAARSTAHNAEDDAHSGRHSADPPETSLRIEPKVKGFRSQGSACTTQADLYTPRQLAGVAPSLRCGLSVRERGLTDGGSRRVGHRGHHVLAWSRGRWRSTAPPRR